MSEAVYGTGGVGQYVASEAHCVMQGRSVRPNVRRGCIVHSGRGQVAAYFFGEDTQELLRAGSPEISCDFVDGKQWGNDTVQSRISSAWTFLQALGAKSDKVLLFGVSMGALCVLNWARANPTKVAAIGLRIPAIDIGDIYDNNRTSSLGFTASTDINSAYGGSGAFATARSAHNPAEHPGDFTGIPILAHYSADDPVCLPSATTTFCGAVGVNAQSVSEGTGHGHGTNPAFDGQIGSFLRQYA